MNDLHTQNEFFLALTQLIPELADLRVTSLRIELNTNKTGWDRPVLITATFYPGKPGSRVQFDGEGKLIEQRRQFRLVLIEEGTGET